MPKSTSNGQCYFCKGSFSKQTMARHLNSCEQRILAEKKSSSKKAQGKSFHLLVEGRYAPQYWMHLEVPASATLYDVDGFLRDIWLECCSHLSEFTIEGERYTASSPFAEADEIDGPGMGMELSEVLRPKMKFNHDYDFGTTTHLTLKVVSEKEGQIASKDVQLLARNEPPIYPCHSCGKPATQICTDCAYEGTGLVCDDCATKHECGEDMLLPVVNSPRVGMCGYTGG